MSFVIFHYFCGMKLHLFWPALLCGCLSLLFSPARAQDTLEIRKAMQAFEQGDLESSLLLFNEAIASFPDSSFLFLYRGISHAELGHPAMAVTDFDQAIRLAPYDPEPYLERARIRTEAGQVDVALKDIRSALKYAPGYVEALLLRSEIYLESGNLSEAMADLDYARRLAPKSAEVYCLRAEAQEMLGEPKLALKEANLAVKLAPEDPVPYATRSTVFFFSGNSQAALTDINQAISLAPEQVSLLNGRAYIRFALGDTVGAFEDLSTYLAADTGAYDAHVTRAYFYETTGQLPAAEQSLLQARKMRPSDVLVASNLGFLYLRMERYADAIQILAPAVEEAPELAFAHSSLGFARFRLGDAKAGLKDLNRAIRLDNGDPRAYYHRALIYQELNKKDNACEDLMMARALGFDAMYQEDIDKLSKAVCR